MQTYLVGGAVRDTLLGLPVKDRDWVVVGATPQQLVARGFTPVGRDFPVFLHPRTHEQYALARTERKTAPGYLGFAVHAAPDVTLEQDLARRDLCINAIAVDAAHTDAQGNFDPARAPLVDPFQGREDLARRRLRHVTDAFREDPVRILRVARFAARFTDFSVAPETLALMRQMAAAGEVDHLVSERVWQELARGLMEQRPSRMIRVLRESGALARLLPELDRLFGIPQPAKYHPEIDTGEHVLMVIDQAATSGQPLAVRWACLLHDLGKGDTPAHVLPHHYGHEAASTRRAREVSERLKAPADCRDLAEMLAREHGILGQAAVLRADTMVKLIERCDALRRPERFLLMLQGAACDHSGRGAGTITAPADWPPLLRWEAVLHAVRSIDAGTIARNCRDKASIPQALHAARVAAVKALDSKDSA